MSYRSESSALDEEILRLVEDWHRYGKEPAAGHFEDLALRLMSYQLQYNRPYARYCGSFGVSESSLPDSWEAIPPVPAAAFKEATLTTFDPARAALAFVTSGTTTGTGGRHYMETATLYDAAAGAAFERFMLHDGAKLRYLNVVPNPPDRPQSSLGHMMAHVSQTFGDERTGWYVRGETLLFDAFVSDVTAAITDDRAVCLATTALGLANVLEEMQRRDLVLSLPRGSRAMETGGFKGRTRAVDRAELYAQTCSRFGLPLHAVVAEFGMTELSSQYYDAFASRGSVDRRRKNGPPWLRTRVVGPDGKTLPNGTAGALVHVDLANRSSCIAISTDDVGVRFDDGLVIVGREAGAALRGCSLDAETLLPR